MLRPVAENFARTLAGSLANIVPKGGFVVDIQQMPDDVVTDDRVIILVRIGKGTETLADSDRAEGFVAAIQMLEVCL